MVHRFLEERYCQGNTLGWTLSSVVLQGQEDITYELELDG